MLLMLLISGSSLLGMSTLYNKSLCTVDKTENLDDSEYLLSVPTSLFKGMFLQIAKSNDVDIDHTNALVQKIKKWSD
jgi:hypothetical protein